VESLYIELIQLKYHLQVMYDVYGHGNVKTEANSIG